jgi:hypothetical protein
VLVEKLSAIKGKFALSTYENEATKSLDFKKVDIDSYCSIPSKRLATKELVFLNYDPNL